MSQASKRRPEPTSNPVRVLGRGLRAQRGVHLTLRGLREGAGKTQVDVRASSRIDQADISRLEARETFDEVQVSTLQRYVSALGGDLELVAVFGDKKFIVTGASTTRLADAPANKASQRPARRGTRPEYDFTGGVRGKYAAVDANIVKTSKAVNDALRSLEGKPARKARRSTTR